MHGKRSDKKKREKRKKKEKKVWWPCKRLACSPSLRLCHLHHDQKGQMPPASPAALPQKTCFLYLIYSFTTSPWTCAHLQLKSSQESQIFSQFPLCSSRWLSMLTHSIWPSPHLPCKQQTTDYLRWLRLWFCGRCRNNVAPKCTQYSFKEIMGALWSWKSQDSFNENIWISVTKSSQ